MSQTKVTETEMLSLCCDACNKGPFKSTTSLKNHKAKAYKGNTTLNEDSQATNNEDTQSTENDYGNDYDTNDTPLSQINTPAPSTKRDDTNTPAPSKRKNKTTSNDDNIYSDVTNRP